MNRLIAACLLPAVLSGCGITAALQGAGQQIGPAVLAIDSDIFAVAVAKYQAAQMFKAQIDGTIVLPPLPPPAIGTPISGSPVTVVPLPTQPPPAPPTSVPLPPISAPRPVPVVP